MSQVLFQANIIDAGNHAKDFSESKIAILFGKEAPPDLKEYCYILDNYKLAKNILPGDQLLVGEETYIITSVGDYVAKNLNDLGHITIKFDGETTADLPGTLHCEDKKFEINVLDKIQIKRSNSNG